MVPANTPLRYTSAVARRKPAVEKKPPPPAVLRPLGAQLRRLRQERDLSQERLAELAGVTYKYLGRVELAKSDPGAEVLVRLARALDVPVGELFNTITPMNTAAYRLTPSDLEGVASAVKDMASALAAIEAAVDRVRSSGPPSGPERPRRSSRT